MARLATTTRVGITTDGTTIQVTGCDVVQVTTSAPIPTVARPYGSGTGTCCPGFVKPSRADFRSTLNNFMYCVCAYRAGVTPSANAKLPWNKLCSTPLRYSSSR